MEMQKQAMLAQQNMQVQQMASETGMQKVQMETQSKMQIMQAEVQYHIQRMQAEAELKSNLMRQEFEYNMQLGGIKENMISKRDQEKEKAKAGRISQQNTQQSQLINQRKNNLPPQTFESNEDSLDGFSLEEFAPR